MKSRNGELLIGASLNTAHIFSSDFKHLLKIFLNLKVMIFLRYPILKETMIDRGLKSVSVPYKLAMRILLVF